MKLIAAIAAKMGDVVYLRPDHGQYDVEDIGIVITAGQYDKDAPHDTVPLYIATARVIKRIDDSERCLEAVSKKLLADVTGYTLRQVNEWVDFAKQGKLDHCLRDDVEEEAEPWQEPTQASEDNADIAAANAYHAAYQDPTLAGTPFDETLQHCPQGPAPKHDDASWGHSDEHDADEPAHGLPESVHRSDKTIEEKAADSDKPAF